MDNTSCDTNIWLILGPILAALLGAVVGGFIREWWVERFYRPKLYIVGDSVIHNIDFSHCRIVVRNNGKRAAENCIGMITLDAIAGDVYEESDVYVIPADESPPILSSTYFTPIEGMSLCWSRLGNQEDCIINRDTKATLEFYMIYPRSHLRIPSEQGWKKLRVKLKIKEYHGKIEVTSANAEPAWAYFKLVPQDGDVELVITERDP